MCCQICTYVYNLPSSRKSLRMAIKDLKVGSLLNWYIISIIFASMVNLFLSRQCMLCLHLETFSFPNNKPFQDYFSKFPWRNPLLQKTWDYLKKKKKLNLCKTENKMVITSGWASWKTRVKIFKDRNLYRVANEPQESPEQYTKCKE